MKGLFSLLTLYLLLLSACSIVSSHTYTEKILNSSDQQIDSGDLLKKLLHADYIILGETHDNPIHHKHQSDIIQHFLDRGIRPTVVLEMLDTNEQDKIEKFHSSKVKTAKEFNTITGFSSKGWSFSDYQALLNTIAKGDLDILGGNLPAKYTRKIIKDGIQVAPDEVQKLLRKFTLTEKQLLELNHEIMTGHCNALPETMLPGMVRVQQARDASLAASMLRSQTPTILITGSGHAKKSRGVPAYLRAMNNTAKIVSISFIEDDSDTIHERVREFDYIWITRPVKRVDPCIAFKKSRKSSD